MGKRHYWMWLLLWAMAAWAESPEQPARFLVVQGGKAGYMDRSGSMVIPCRYDAAGKYSEGLAAVKVGKAWGFIDAAGQVIVMPKYTAASRFSEGMAVVQQEKRWGYIDRSGREVVPPVFFRADAFSEGLAHVRRTGKRDEPGAYIDRTGTIVLDGHGKPYQIENRFREGFAAVDGKGMGVNSGGFIDRQGKLHGEGRFRQVRNFSEGLAAVQGQDDQWGYIDQAFTQVIPTRYDRASDFQEGLAEVEIEGESGYVDKTGKVVIPLRHQGGLSFSEGMAMVQEKNLWGVIQFVFTFGRHGEILRSGYIDRAGEKKIPARYHWGMPFEQGLARVSDRESCWYIDPQGNRVGEMMKSADFSRIVN